MEITVKRLLTSHIDKIVTVSYERDGYEAYITGKMRMLREDVMLLSVSSEGLGGYCQFRLEDVHSIVINSQPDVINRELVVVPKILIKSNDGENGDR